LVVGRCIDAIALHSIAYIMICMCIRKLSAQVLDALMKQLTVPITETMNTYKYSLKELHPFETTVMELTVVARSKAGLPHLDDVLKDLQVLRANTSRIGKDFAGTLLQLGSDEEFMLADYLYTTPGLNCIISTIILSHSSSLAPP
jgi:hypothetical protein